MCRLPAVVIVAACMLPVPLAACHDATEPVQGRTIDLTERLGTQISGDSEAVETSVSWSLDGTMIYYVAQGQLTRALLSGADRSIVLPRGRPILPIPLPADDFLGTIAAGRAGDLYVMGAVSSADLTGGVLHVIADSNQVWLSNLRGPRGIALAPGGDRLVYAATASVDGQQGLASYELASGVSTALPTGDPRALSPDGAELFYIDSDGAYHTAALATGETTSIAIGLPQDIPEGIRWTSEGLQVLFRRFDESRGNYDYYLRDVAADTNVLFYQESFDSTQSEVAAWSPDGREMALAITICVAMGATSCQSVHTALYVVGVPDGTETWVAGVRNHEFMSPKFSPDDGNIAYVVGGRLYVSPIR